MKILSNRRRTRLSQTLEFNNSKFLTSAALKLLRGGAKVEAALKRAFTVGEADVKVNWERKIFLEIGELK